LTFLDLFTISQHIFNIQLPAYFAGYPLIYKGESIGVLGMFSEKRLRPADFEILGIFCDQLSKELAGLFDTLGFLSIK
jgi:hypothetical protein